MADLERADDHRPVPEQLAEERLVELDGIDCPKLHVFVRRRSVPLTT